MNLATNIRNNWKDYFYITLGSLIVALAINIFLVPYKIEPGGVSGIATVIHYLSGGKLPVGLTAFAFNIPLFIAGIKFIGRKFALRTLTGIILLSLFIDTTASITKDFAKDYWSELEHLTFAPDLLLYSIFGGSLMGLGLGIVFKSGATTGGSDLLARIINHFKPNLTIGQILLLIETFIVIFAAISFNSFLLALYAIIALYLQSKVIDAVIEGINFAKAVFIISDKSNEIANVILKDLERGVTSLKGVGMYTGSEKNVLLCILHRGQISDLKEIVGTIDQKAFIILTDVREVLGEGFKTY